MEFEAHPLVKKIHALTYRSFESGVDQEEARVRDLYIAAKFYSVNLEYLHKSGLAERTGSLEGLKLPFKGIGSARNDSTAVEGNLIVKLHNH